jgi:hypothetical protein
MDGRLADEIKKKIHSGEVTNATLKTDDRVLARITDGIYRKPSSALRELIANAYDADSSEVHIHTDAPRFSELRVKDNGIGLSADGLENLIEHIGGSAKRTPKGVDLKISNHTDFGVSLGGRRIIGKLGIGLFSVAQLTQHFQIITKQKGTSFRLIADVVLRVYEEDSLHDQTESFEGGSVKIWAEPASDIESQGTEIILLSLKDQVRDMLRSRERWLDDNKPEAEDPNISPKEPPLYHIGVMDRQTFDTILKSADLPWVHSDPPDDRMKKLVVAVKKQHLQTTANPKIEYILDNYLQMVWELSLSTPIDYIEEHPFDLAGVSGVRFYEFKSDLKGQAMSIDLKKGESLRDRLGLECPQRGSNTAFSVYIDGTQLLRPISFSELPKSANAIRDAMFFVGKIELDLSDRPLDVTGGKSLSFEAYLLWNHIIVPIEHRGVLVRIGGASGTLYDETFMKYQVSEQTRLRQLTGEIFIKSGLDPALNIDRESFNTSHPHYRVIMNWLHGAIRQFTNTNKALGKEIRESNQELESKKITGDIERVTQDEIRIVAGEEYDIPEVVFSSSETGPSLFEGRKSGSLVYNRNAVFADTPKKKVRRKKADGPGAQFEKQIESVAKILHVHGLFDDIAYKKQQEILRAIVKIFSATR